MVACSEFEGHLVQQQQQLNGDLCMVATAGVPSVHGVMTTVFGQGYGD